MFNCHHLDCARLAGRRKRTVFGRSSCYLDDDGGGCGDDDIGAGL